MRIVLASLGTMGDFQPFLALARGLYEQGHKPILAMSPDFAKRAKALDIEFAPIGPPMQEMNMYSRIASSLEFQNPIEQTKHSISTILPFIPQMYQQLSEFCSGADGLVYFPYQLAARMVYEKMGIPFISMHFSPFGAFGNKHLKEATASIINECREKTGFPPLDDPLGIDGISPKLALYPVSKHIFRRPIKWPEHYHVTGYLFLDEEAGVDTELLEFVNKKDAPLVVITFGSSVHSDPQALTELLIEAIKDVGCKAIIQQGWSGLGSEQIPDNIKIMGFIPHTWLFPKADCVVHHGAAGTTAAVLRSGVPSVIVPHWLDQPIWAELVRGMGCASAVIPHSRLNAKDLAEAIKKALNSPAYSQKAALFGEKVRSEDGVRVACQLIEQVLTCS